MEAVYTGWFREFTFPDLEAACHSVWGGAMLTTASHVPFFATANGRTIGASYSINIMIESLTDTTVRVLGKPSREAFEAALAGMALPADAAPNVVVVGDDPGLEIAMARSVGAFGICITTGLMKRNAVAGLPLEQQPELLIDDLNTLRRALA